MNRSNHPSSSTRGGGGGSAAGNKPGFNSTARGAAGGAVRTGQAMGGAQAVPNVRGGRGASRGGGISAGRGRGGARFGGRDWDKVSLFGAMRALESKAMRVAIGERNLEES